MAGWLISVGGSALQLFLGSSGNLTNTTIRDAMVNVWNTLQALASFLQTIFSSQMDAWTEAEPDIVDGAMGLGELAYNERAAWHRLLTLILPNSLSWLDGRLRQWARGRYDWQVRDFWKFFRQYWIWRDEIRSWRRLFVDPSLVTDNAYRRWLKTWPQAQWFRWKRYFDHPTEFGAWAAPWIARPLYNHLRKREHQILLDQFTALLVDATPEVAKHVELAAVRILTAPR